MSPLRAVLEVPVTPDRETARELARDELARREYSENEPGLVSRAIAWGFDRVAELLDRASGPGGGSVLAIVLLVLLVVAVGVAVRWRVGPLARTVRAEPLLREQGVTAQDYRAEADRLAAAGQWQPAVRARLRAIIRGLEERGLLDPRPGRTAHEAAYEAGQLLPGQADTLRRGADVFAGIAYGGGQADQQAHDLLRKVDDDVRAARPTVAAPPSAARWALPGADR
ncbi:DUF4129 domain-containing protein [Motilibacter aurantiacus]|uniref:DUF4129 domain-containing protein n=1 Tax=Motilibacter aurantiacus TaxID=2714955 RepID=UPI00140737E9|nr:DUF4129 domain-containing protein [Motilibacter aurantiacus]NHC43734.1 DUF4129 domain-containing protein [Motilibacter aurantiacus]